MSVIRYNEWNVSVIEYGAKRTNDKGSASLMLLDGTTKRSLYISTPEMMTWGIGDYVDESGKSNEKYTLSLAFGQNGSAQEQEFLRKLTEFENKLLDDAEKHSEQWFGEPMTKEVLKHMYFPFLKYTKIKGTKRNDLSKPPSLRAKVPFYNGQWGDSFVIFSSTKEKLFPSESTELTPVDLIPKMSKVACVLQFSGIWFGGKGWGLTIRATQAVVRQQVRNNINAMCQIDLDNEEEQEAQPQQQAPPPPPQVKKTIVASTYDSDEEPQAQVATPAPTPAEQPVQVQQEVAQVVAAPKKKIVKKAST
jgi:hypothetical protein